MFCLFLGTFRIKKFNVGEAEDAREYEELRTKANKRDSGIVIENIRDLTEVTEITDAERNKIRNERWYIVVSWWEKDKEPVKEPPNSERGFYLERSARTDGEN